jgi:hypothetical protein
VLVPGQVDWSKRDNVRKQFELESALGPMSKMPLAAASARPSACMARTELAETERVSVRAAHRRPGRSDGGAAAMSY